MTFSEKLKTRFIFPKILHKGALISQKTEWSFIYSALLNHYNNKVAGLSWTTNAFEDWHNGFA